MGTPNSPPTRRHWLLAVLLAVVGIIVAVIALVSQPPSGLSSGQKTVILRQALTAPNPTCNPPLGAGRMGICTSNAGLAQLLGRPRTIHGILGVDVSSYQGCANLSGTSFAIAKLNESTSYVDAYAHCNITNAKARHEPNGGYDFLRPGRTSPQAECAVFARQYRRVGVTGPAIADVEATVLGRAGTARYVRAWFTCVHGHLPHVTLIEYTGKWFSDPSVGGSAGTLNLWLSAYANSFFLPIGFHSVLIWQYSDGQVGPNPHIHGYDSDVFLGSHARFVAIFTGHTVPSYSNAQAQKDCAGLNHYRRTLKKHGHTTASLRARGAHDRAALMRHNYTCTKHHGARRK